MTHYGFGAFRLDAEQRALYLRSDLVPLQNKAFDLLVRLADDFGRLVTHEQLTNHLWPDVAVDANNLPHNVSLVRKALQGDPRVRVENVPRQGYRLLLVGVAGQDCPPADQRIRETTSADGTRLAFATTGSGPALVKVANWLGHLELEWSFPAWRAWLHALGAGHRLVRYDARGHGMSQRDVDDLSQRAFVADLEAVFDAAEVDRAPIVGISQGAAVAIEYAARHPERVSSLILIGGCARGWRRKGNPAVEAHFSSLMALMRRSWGTSNPAFRQIFTTAFFPEGPLERFHWFNDLQRQTATPDAAADLLYALGDVDVRERLAALRVPTLILHSRGDCVVPLTDGRELAEGIDGSRFVILESKNHLLLPDDSEWPRLVGEVGAFLARDSRERRG